jgi:hypothetical protein
MRCQEITAEVTSWIEFVRELDISKLTDSEINSICSAVVTVDVLCRGARLQAIFMEAGRRLECESTSGNKILERESTSGNKISEQAFEEASSSPRVVDVVTPPAPTPAPALVTPSVTQPVTLETPPEEASKALCVACKGTGVASSGKSCRACSGKYVIVKQTGVTVESAPLFDFLNSAVESFNEHSGGKQVLTVDVPVSAEAPSAEAPSDEAPSDEAQVKRKRGRPKKVQEQVQEQVQKPEMTPEREAEVAAWAKDRIRPDVLAPPFHEVETVDYFCGSILCDAPLCGRDNTIIRIPKEPVDQCYVQYRCSDCGERGQVLYNREELVSVMQEDRRVNYDVLIANQPKYKQAYEAARVEFLTPRERKIEVPRNRPKLLPRPVAVAVQMTPIEEPQKEYVPDVVNDLDGIESTEEAKRIVGDVLNRVAPMAVDLNVAEAELTASLLSMHRDLLVSQWEGLTGQTWREGQDVEQSAREVVRSILNIKGE